jgi:uncharacterized protein YbjQ (UPF0145 family)
LLLRFSFKQVGNVLNCYLFVDFFNYNCKMKDKIILSNTVTIYGKEISESLGIVRGNTVRARNIGRDLFAGLKNIVGGEIKEYSKLMTEAREEALSRMVQEAIKLEADALVNVRFTTAAVMQGASEILVYGTAVKFNK